MNIEFEQIAAYEGEQIPQAAARLATDKEFEHWLSKLNVPISVLTEKKIETRYDFDMALTLPFLCLLEEKTTSGVHMDQIENLPEQGFFLTNHRDIILDAGFLSIKTWFGHQIRPYIGMGDNLLAAQWIEDLVRINRAFIVRRQGTPREIMTNSIHLSEYIQMLNEKGESFWLAQREGRAKDGNDVTQPAVLKMLTLADKGDFLSAIEKLHITPIAITYEFDPCDMLKAVEMQLKRDVEGWKKQKSDDVRSMQTGLMGWKGEVHFVVTPTLSHEELESIRKQSDVRNEQIRLTAALIDKHIHAAYHIAWTNQAAYDIQQGKQNELTEKMEAYIASKIEKADLPNKDVAFLREKMIEMYANPLINHLAAL